MERKERWDRNLPRQLRHHSRRDREAVTRGGKKNLIKPLRRKVMRKRGVWNILAYISKRGTKLLGALKNQARGNNDIKTVNVRK